MINAKWKKIEEDVKLAIDILKSGNQRITVSKIASLCGVPIAQIYTCSSARQFVRSSKKKAKPASKPIPLDKVSPTVEAYSEYILDSYFVHAESVQDVQSQMAIEVEGFNKERFNLALSALERDGKLIKSSLPGRYIAAPAPTVAVQREELASVEKTPEEKCYELNYQLPLSKGVSKLSMPSVLSDDDKEFLQDWWKLIEKRRLHK
jgi:hypothetical protein